MIGESVRGTNINQQNKSIPCKNKNKKQRTSKHVFLFGMLDHARY
jgi:hypothetical protein